MFKKLAVSVLTAATLASTSAFAAGGHKEVNDYAF